MTLQPESFQTIRRSEAIPGFAQGKKKERITQIELES